MLDGFLVKQEDIDPAYRTRMGDKVVKVKDITITHSIGRDINFETIRSLVLHYADSEEFSLPEDMTEEVSVTYASKIQRDRYNFVLYGKDVSKKFQVTYGKRQLVRDGSFDTVPYGY